jgi:hypothetical protein
MFDDHFVHSDRSQRKQRSHETSNSYTNVRGHDQHCRSDYELAMALQQEEHSRQQRGARNPQRNGQPDQRQHVQEAIPQRADSRRRRDKDDGDCAIL